MRRTLTYLTLAVVLLVATVPGGVAAAADDAADDGHVVEISDLTVTVADTHVRGTGLPDRSVDSASYTVHDATLATDGFTVEIDGETHRIGAITLIVDDVGVEVENVSIGAGGGN